MKDIIHLEKTEELTGRQIEITEIGTIEKNRSVAQSKEEKQQEVKNQDPQVDLVNYDYKQS